MYQESTLEHIQALMSETDPKSATVIMLDTLANEIRHLSKRLDLVERIFSRVMQQDLRLDTLEFNSNLPVKPGISACLGNLIHRIETIESIINQEEIEDDGRS